MELDEQEEINRKQLAEATQHHEFEFLDAVSKGS